MANNFFTKAVNEYWAKIIAVLPGFFKRSIPTTEGVLADIKARINNAVLQIVSKRIKNVAHYIYVKVKSFVKSGHGEYNDDIERDIMNALKKLGVKHRLVSDVMKQRQNQKNHHILPDVAIQMLSEIDSKIRSNFRDLVEFHNIDQFSKHFEFYDISRLVYDLIDTQRVFGPKPIKTISEFYSYVPNKINFFVDEYFKLTYIGILLCCTYCYAKSDQNPSKLSEIQLLCDKFNTLVSITEKEKNKVKDLQDRLNKPEIIKKEIEEKIKEIKKDSNALMKFECTRKLFEYLNQKYGWISWLSVEIPVDRAWHYPNDSSMCYIYKDEKCKMVVVRGDKDWIFDTKYEPASSILVKEQGTEIQRAIRILIDSRAHSKNQISEEEMLKNIAKNVEEYAAYYSLKANVVVTTSFASANPKFSMSVMGDDDFTLIMGDSIEPYTVYAVFTKQTKALHSKL